MNSNLIPALNLMSELVVLIKALKPDFMFNITSKCFFLFKFHGTRPVIGRTHWSFYSNYSVMKLFYRLSIFYYFCVWNWNESFWNRRKTKYKRIIFFFVSASRYIPYIEGYTEGTYQTNVKKLLSPKFWKYCVFAICFDSKAKKWKY